MFEPNCVIAIIAPEVSLKSNKVQERIHSILKKNISYILEKNNINYSSINISAGRVFIYTIEIEKIIFVLKNCFGLYYLIPAQCEKVIGFDNVCEKALKICDKNIFGEFAVRCKSFVKEKSKEFEIELGSKILSIIPNTKVNLSNPKTQLNLIVFKDKAFFYFNGFDGAKGMPIGSQGNVVLIANNIVDSKKMVLLLLKSGCRVFVVGKKIVGFDSFSVKNIFLEEAISFYKSDSVNAFFCDVRNINAKKSIDKKIGVKSFAPLLDL